MDRYSHGISHGEAFSEDDPAGMWVMFDDAQAAIAAAVAAERERCAVLCEGLGVAAESSSTGLRLAGELSMSTACAKLIRA